MNTVAGGLCSMILRGCCATCSSYGQPNPPASVMQSRAMYFRHLSRVARCNLRRHVPFASLTMGTISEKTVESHARPKERTPKILIIDDKLDTLLLLRELLSSRGYEVVTSNETHEVKEIIRSERPDLILLDVVMPGKSGYDVCRELKEDRLTRLIPIVMITGLS